MENNVLEQCQAYWYVEEGKKKGYVIVTQKRNICLIMFLAVVKEYRSQGIGSKCLQEVLQHYQENEIVLEAEKTMPEDKQEVKEEKQRRIRFYEKNGFRILEQIEYTFMKKPYVLMYSIRKKLQPKEIAETVQEIYEDLTKGKKLVQYKIRDED